MSDAVIDDPTPPTVGEAREHMLSQVKRLGVRACSYSIGPEWSLTCDCKCGVESDSSPSEHVYCGEQTGCPELRAVYRMLKAMTDEEFAAIHERIHAQMLDAWREYQRTHPDV